MTVTLLGLDGASVANLRRAMNYTNLPNFKKVMEEGLVSDLQSSYPYVTAPAWTSVFSGVNPGKHGIFDLLQVGAEGVKAPNMRSCEVPFLWDYLSWAGKKVLVTGIPNIHPAPVVNGVFVTGRLVPSLSTFPEGLTESFDLSGFEYGATSLAKQWKGIRKSGMDSFAETGIEQLKKRVRASLALKDSQKWELAILVDSMPDEVFHSAYEQEDVLEDVFQVLDSWLGTLIAQVNQGDALVIVSDHGFSEIRGRFFINEWLRTKKYIPADMESRMSKVDDSRSGRVLREIRTPFHVLKRLRQGNKGSSEKEGSSSARVLAKRLDAHEDAGSEAFANVISLDQVTWLKVLKKSRADHSDTLNSLMVEVQDMERQGLVKRSFLTSNLFRGKHAAEAPGEILVEATDGLSFAAGFKPGELVGKPNPMRKGTHRREGLLVLFGTSSIRPKSTPNIYDVLPTVLGILGLPTPDFIDGVDLLTESGVNKDNLGQGIPQSRKQDGVN